MDFEDLADRPGWKVGPVAADPREPPPPSPRDDMLSLYGRGPGEWDHRLYLVPTATRIEEIVEFFEVGSHGARLHRWDERETMDLVTDRLCEIDAIIPGSIELADDASLRFRFWRRMRQDELEEIEALFDRVDEVQAGLERYVNGVSGGSLLAEARESGALRLRWR